MITIPLVIQQHQLECVYLYFLLFSLFIDISFLFIKPEPPPQQPKIAVLPPTQPAPYQPPIYTPTPMPAPIPAPIQQPRDNYGSDSKQTSTRVDLTAFERQQAELEQREKRIAERERELKGSPAEVGRTLISFLFFIS